VQTWVRFVLFIYDLNLMVIYSVLKICLAVFLLNGGHSNSKLVKMSFAPFTYIQNIHFVIGVSLVLRHWYFSVF